MPAGDLTFQGDLLLRILVAGGVGGGGGRQGGGGGHTPPPPPPPPAPGAAGRGPAIGSEREMHDPPAGTRTHLLVALGSALFTVLSAHGFGGGTGGPTNGDPPRLPAPNVTGLGLLR